MRQKRILLAFVKPVHFVNKHQRAQALMLRQLRFFNCLTNVLDATQHRADAQELGIKGIGHQTGDGGFSYAWRAPQNAAVRLTGLECKTQGHALAQQMLLAHHLAQVSRAQALGQWGMGGYVGRFHLTLPRIMA
jgi:hypothetical protein